MSQLIGTVEVAGKVFTVSDLSAEGELHLGALLAKLYEKQNGSPYARAKDMIEEMPEKYRQWAITEAVRGKIAGETPGFQAWMEARRTPEGTRLELYMRARKHHPDLRQVEVDAIVNEMNYLDVLSEITRIISPAKKEGEDDSKS